jgi:hypothetical protein
MCLEEFIEPTLGQGLPAIRAQSFPALPLTAFWL